MRVAWIKVHWKEILCGTLLSIGLIMMIVLFREANLLNSRRIWSIGLITNLLIALGLCGLLQYDLNKRYGDWMPIEPADYDTWKETLKIRQKKMNQTFGFLLALAIAFLLYQMMSNFGYFFRYYYNYAMGYLFIATVVIQYTLCQNITSRFMNRLLDLLMEAMTEVSKERLAEAVEMEKKSIEQTARSERLKVDLISNVSHDLKTPLTSMVGYIELLKKEELGEVSRDYVEVISDKAQKLREMIESLFNLAKASSGNIHLEMEPVDLNMLIDQLFADMEDKMQGSDLQFVRLLTEEDTRMVSDNIHLYRICQNLLENAIKYSARGTRVFVKTWAKEERVYLEMTNTAGYLMDFDKEDIIERFSRGDKARSSEGNGLGLAIVSTYAGALGGAFDIQIDCDQFKVRLDFPRGQVEVCTDKLLG
jgi:signal transduction histidine kinase